MVLDNDTRGWIMTALSGVACVLGAAIIYIDIPLRRIPRYRNFSIEQSNTFSTCSLSLSFGVMIFSALYKMLPSAKQNLTAGGFSPKAAAWTLVGCFIAGAAGIQVISKVCHQYMPSHVVECDHQHDKEGEEPTHVSHDHQDHSGFHSHHGHSSHPGPARRHASFPANFRSGYGTLAGENETQTGSQPDASTPTAPQDQNADERPSLARRPSLQKIRSAASALFQTARRECDPERGQCYGTSDLCPKECFDIIQSRRPSFHHFKLARPIAPQRAATEAVRGNERQRLLSVNEEAPLTLQPSASSELPSEANSRESTGSSDTVYDFDSQLHKSNADDEEDPHTTHHHHVPDNNFMSIGLQTSIAIALHKLPEGFITFATNHANPKLGLSVFLALFVHNITEGFALSLPIYLALHSRLKAIIWSFVLGGFSQPIGAAFAALWFRLAGKGDNAPGETVYGAMFAVTAGIMACVGCQIFAEAMGLTHRRGLCLAFAFLGMGILGVSSALTA